MAKRTDRNKDRQRRCGFQPHEYHDSHPVWICSACGAQYGQRPCGLACWHVGACGICGIVASVTEPRDYGGLRPDWEGLRMVDAASSRMNTRQDGASTVGASTFPMTITITVQDREVREALARLRARLDDLSPAMDAIGQRLEERISARFEDERDPDGVPWAPWAPITQETYPEDGNKRILDRYGDMLKSLNHQADKDSVLVGFGQPYAAYHEFGTQTMPRRGMLFSDPDAGELGEDDRGEVLELLRDFLDV